MFELLTRLDVAAWNVFFFVPSSQEDRAEMLSAEETEQAFAKLYAGLWPGSLPGENYGRATLPALSSPAAGAGDQDAFSRNGCGSLRAQGRKRQPWIVFMDYKGEVYPSRFLPVSAGNVTHHSLSEVYSESPLFTSLRDVSRLKGKCGRCPVRTICGGSRARAYAVTGDLFAADHRAGTNLAPSR